MRVFFFISLLMMSKSVIGQVQNKLEGTWKVIALSDDEMAFDFKEDSASFNKSANIDTLTAKLMVKPLMSMFGEILYIFEKDGHFSEKHNGEMDGEGNYLIDSKKSIITLKGKRNGVTFTEKVLFQFKRNYLLLTPFEDRSSPKLTLEKIKRK